MIKFIKKYYKTILIIVSIIILAFVLIFFAGKNILPDILGNTKTDGLTSVSTTSGKLIDKKAPYFDLSDGLGNRIKLNSFLNAPIVLVFWATWNKESADQIKIFDDYLSHKNIQNSLVKVIAVNSLEEISIVKSFMRRGDYNVSVALDVTGDTSNQYNIKSLPTTYFIDKDGIVKEVYTGILSENMIVDKVEKILK